MGQKGRERVVLNCGVQKSLKLTLKAAHIKYSYAEEKKTNIYNHRLLKYTNHQISTISMN